MKECNMFEQAMNTMDLEALNYECPVHAHDLIGGYVNFGGNIGLIRLTGFAGKGAFRVAYNTDYTHEGKEYVVKVARGMRNVDDNLYERQFYKTLKNTEYAHWVPEFKACTSDGKFLLCEKVKPFCVSSTCSYHEKYTDECYQFIYNNIDLLTEEEIEEYNTERQVEMLCERILPDWLQSDIHTGNVGINARGDLVKLDIGGDSTTLEEMRECVNGTHNQLPF